MNAPDSQRTRLRKLAIKRNNGGGGGLDVSTAARSPDGRAARRVVPINTASRRNSLMSNGKRTTSSTLGIPIPEVPKREHVPRIPLPKVDDRLDPSRVTESDYFYYGKNTERFWEEQEKALLSTSRNSATTRSTSRHMYRHVESRNERPLSSRSRTSFSFGNIIGGKTQAEIISLNDTRTMFDELEEKQLGEIVEKIFQQSKALTLWSMSEGMSTLSNRTPNTAYFMDDFERYVRTDSQMRSRPASALSGRRSTTSTILSRTATPQLEGRRSTETAQEEYFTPRVRDSQTQSVIDRFISTQGTGGVLQSTQSATFIDVPKESIFDPVINDPTWRSYVSSANGRAVNSIYHPCTRRPSYIASYVDKTTVTNESLYTYITTELVEEIDLEHCHWISNGILESIGQFCLQLAVLNLQNCIQLRDRTLSVISAGCPNIASINIGLCNLVTDEGLMEIFVHCRNLHVLSIHSCPKVTGTSFQYIENCTSLEVLDVSYCEALKDLALEHVAEHCQYLMRLDMSGCISLGDDGILSICRSCENVETLRLNLCDQSILTSHSLRSITLYGSSLRILEFTGVSQLTDQDVLEIAKSGIGIEFLSLNGCSNLTDKSLSAIMRYCRNLKCCEICSCRSITLQAMIELVHNVRSLLKFVVSGCNISDSELEILRNVTIRCMIIKQGVSTAKPRHMATMKPRSKKKLKKKKGKKGAKKIKK